MIISWNTTNKCNMSCKHCYRDAKEAHPEELNTDEAKMLIEEIAKAGFKIMIFSGGEPLLRPDIFELIQHAVKFKLRPVLGSNGTLISKEIAYKLKSSGAMGIGISLDSMNPIKHNDFRGLQYAWEWAVRGMEYCKQAGLGFQIHTTVMEWNYKEVLEITDFAVKMGAVAHHIFFLVPTGRGANIEEEFLNAEQYETLLTNIVQKQKQIKIEVKPTCAPQFMRIAKEQGVSFRFSKGCLAGISYCIINPKGDVQPCAYLDIPVDNIRLNPFSEIWKTNSILQKLRTLEYEGKCGSCIYKSLCGGCRARAAYYNEGDYMGEETLCMFDGGR
ncbi:putative heme d1 biosynthesis radical SAM protein NirJ2 [Cellulosilyticum sp. I15G10I2]|uniref:putative heme d1 biosynthesis radical SAM protein NirJ2 n=1 Tax=Cellulosilyticum sp. I15G10I2 TaxID=1892843 RepID=UPI00085C6671|nr:putative heme d1 biosynthesis radical SAM protein NirJ2 [Cellulosilyticum sp. I15G10I2]